jgi:FkbM family methyltransferase
MFDTKEVTSPHGREMEIAYREGTSDLSCIGATFTLWGFSGNEYLLRDHPPMTGWAIDVGAHIGAVALALAVDNPDLRILAVEALPENCDVLRESIRMNGITNIEVVEAAATDRKRKSVAIAYDWTEGESLDESYVANNRFIGGMIDDPSGKTIHPPGVSLGSLMDERGIDRVRFLKIDCEGCEWKFLTSPAVDRVDELIGEFHFGGGLATVHKLLDDTHIVQYLGGDKGAEENSVGLFWAHHR